VRQRIELLGLSTVQAARPGAPRGTSSFSLLDLTAESRELIARRKDGSRVDVIVSFSSVKDLGLHTLIFIDITRRKKLEQEIVEIASLEQARIGQMLHDDIGQELTALGLLVGTLVEDLWLESSPSITLARFIERNVGRTLQKVRAVAHGLAVGEIEPEAFIDALADLLHRIGEISGVRCSFHADNNVRIDGRNEATQLYHIAQEACSNVLRHSGARNLKVSLQTDGSVVVLRIRDDGKGIGEAQEGLGQRIMRDRSRLIGASFSIGPAEPNGTQVTCILKSRAMTSGGSPERKASPES
jgi:signal transduction histidine kinase